MAAIFGLARRVCDVPRDFEAQHKYGPKSGICHEERVANAYLAGMLEGGDEELRRSLKRLVDRREYAEAAELCAALLDGKHLVEKYGDADTAQAKFVQSRRHLTFFLY